MADETPTTATTPLKNIKIGNTIYPLGGGLKGHKLTVTWDLFGAAYTQNIMLLFADGRLLLVDNAYLTNGEHNSASSIAEGTSATFENVVAYSEYGLWRGIDNHIAVGASDKGAAMYRYFPSVLLTEDTKISRGRMCILKGTLIHLADGSVKPIERITYDDDLMVWDFDEGHYSHAKPAWVKKVEKGEYYFRNRYESGRELLTTGQSATGWGHRHFDYDRMEFRYCPTTVGDRIMTTSCLGVGGGWERHVSCERVDGECEFYNVITERHFNVIANGIWTSCSLNNLYPIKDFKYCRTAMENTIGREEFVAAVASDRAGYYFDALRIGECDAGRKDSLVAYVKNLIEKEVSR